MGIQHLDVSKGGYSRVTFSKNLAFFTGHAAPQYQTLKEQAEGILKRYDELFKQFGLKKSNILYTTCFMKNADDEDEFADIYFQWIDPQNPPAGVTVTGLPIQHSPVGDNILMELSFIVATNDSLPIKRYDVTRGCRMVEYDGMAYFTGHVYPKVDTLGEQVAGVLNRYDELFEKFGLKKENVIAANGFIKNMAHYGEIAEPFNAYFGENPPAGVIVEAPPRQNTPFGPKLEIELALFVATGENPQITRRDVVPGMSRVVEYNGIAWFTGHSARPEFKTLATQSEAVMKRYAELFEQFGYKKENILMEYGYVRDIEQVNDYLGARKVFIDPENPPAGVVVQAKPSGNENQLEVQLIVNLD